MKKVLFMLMLILFIGVGSESIVTKADVYDGTTLDTGIYWFGENGESEKYIEGQENKFFDSSKPTVIFTHGWQPNSTKILKRSNFISEYHTKIGSDHWVEKGWNIGIFYWNQFADEVELKNAEAKIWTNNTLKGLRWRKADETYSDYEGEESSVTDMFINEYLKCMKEFSGSEIRLVGHSLGNQLVTNASKILDDKIVNDEIGKNLMPNRVALLDPFWSKHSKSYLNGKWTGEICREYVTHLKDKGVMFEEYKSSNINDFLIGDSNFAMRRMTIFTDYHPDYISIIDQTSRHGAINTWYFQSFGYEAPNEFVGESISGKKACSASTIMSRFKEMFIQDKSYWNQRDGRETPTLSDDTFELVSWE